MKSWSIWTPPAAWMKNRSDVHAGIFGEHPAVMLTCARAGVAVQSNAPIPPVIGSRLISMTHLLEESGFIEPSMGPAAGHGRIGGGGESFACHFCVLMLSRSTNAS